MKNATSRVLNFALYLSFCFLIGTGLLLSLRLPPGSRGGHGQSFLGQGRHDWGDMHTWVSYVFIALITAHLVIHHKWLRKIASGGKSWRLGVGIMAGLAIILFFVVYPIGSHHH